MADRKKEPLGKRIRYGFDNFMSRGGISVFLALMVLFLGAIALTAALRFAANLVMPQEGLEDLATQWWLSFLQIADGGAIGEDTGSNVANRVVGIIALFLGMVLFSSLVAFITSQFEEMISTMRKGKSDVIEEGHTLILGYGDRVVEIVRELVIANESEKRPAIVVLADREKDEMDDFFRDRVPDPRNTRIITRSGSPSSMYLLKRAGIMTAKSVIILNDSDDDAPAEEQQLSDARVLKTILAVIACTGEEALPPIIAEVHSAERRDLARSISERIAVVNEHVILAKLMVQTSRVSGLALVYDDLVGFEGNEFYFFRPKEGWAGATFAEAMFRFPTCSLLGVRKADGKIRINLPGSTVLEDADEAIVLAEDDSVIRYLRQGPGVKAPAAVPALRIEKKAEKELLVGWSSKAALIMDEYSKYLVPGSSIDLIHPDPDEVVEGAFAEVQARYPSIGMRILRADIVRRGTLEEVGPEQYDNVILLTGDSGDAELRDSDTIAKLLEFRSYFRRFDKASLKTQLITEVADSDNIEVIQEAGVKDFLISNRFVSKIFAQVSQEPDVLRIYEDLFSPEGSEVYIKPLAKYLPSLPARVSFGELCAAALAVGECCFGVRIMAEEDDADRHFGIYINPDKNRMLDLGPRDCLITLAEDEC